MNVGDALVNAQRARLGMGEPFYGYLARALYTSAPATQAPGWSAASWPAVSRLSFQPFAAVGVRLLGWAGLAYTVFTLVRSLRATSGSDGDANARVGSLLGLSRGTVDSVARLAAAHLFPGTNAGARGRRQRLANGAVSVFRLAARYHGAVRRLRRSR